MENRFELIAVSADTFAVDFARDVRAGFTAHPKYLHCRYFYDAEGSRLFEEICTLPEYYLTRAETAILDRHAADVAAKVPTNVTVVELGSGAATKTRIILDALQKKSSAIHYVPVDISRPALEQSSRALLSEYPQLRITAIAGEYHDGLEHLRTGIRGPKLILWLGSNIGNLHRQDAAQFLRRLREIMLPHDRLLVGIDLRKDRTVLERAYDDARGVTARFNLNLLARINSELAGQFDLESFQHRAFYNETQGRIEMYLASKIKQRVAIDKLSLEVPFEAGEAIHTENSYKYSPSEIQTLAAEAKLRVEEQWLDPAGQFSANLFAIAE